MNLIIDTGNTRSKLGIFKGTELLYSSATFDPEREAGELIRKYPVIRGIISNVNQEDVWDFSIPLLSLTHETPLPFQIKYNTPHTLGRDRIALAAAAYYTYPAQDCLVVDAGTCLTYDFIDRNGTFRGGGISPGMEMRLKALNQYTARLPKIEYHPNFDLLGDSTENSILSGTVGGMIREVKATIDAYKMRYPDLIAILSGGDQSLFEDLAKNSIFAPPEFLLSGLNYILEYNAERF